MAAQQTIRVILFGIEIGTIGFDEQTNRSSFQFHPDFLQRADLQNIFPDTKIIKRVPQVQLFSQFQSNTFKGLPPQFADSLPDKFGSIILNEWIKQEENRSLNALEQLTYISNRGMGALEYKPQKQLPDHSRIQIEQVIQILKNVLGLKRSAKQDTLNQAALVNIFKIGTSAGGAKPKILISEHKKTKEIISGDIETSDDYNHYLIKLNLEEYDSYQAEIIEYCYSIILKQLGIRMTDCKLIDQKHFATIRFDRQNGEKQHILTATGMTGWDFKSAEYSSYENLFSLCSFLKLPHAQLEELYKRMIFNVVFRNDDDHLKNHSFIYNCEKDNWQLSPVYDVTYSLNPQLNVLNSRRALSINGKRSKIQLEDVLKIATAFTIKNPKSLIRETQAKKELLVKLLQEHSIPDSVVQTMSKSFANFIS